MNNMKVISITTASLLLAPIFILAACSSEPTKAGASPEVLRNVSVASAQGGMVPDYLNAVGTVRAAHSSQVASQMMGNIMEVRVHEGDRVSRGQVLAVIDDSQPRAALDRAEAAKNAAQHEVIAADSDFQLAEATFKRYTDLYEKKSVSPQEFDEVKARFQGAQARRDMSHAGQAQAQAAVAQAHTAFEYSRVRAPLDGVVTEKKAEAGTLASPGMALFVVEDPRLYRLEASLDEADIGLVRTGQKITVQIDSLDSELAGKVTQIVPAADPATRSFLVKIDLPVEKRLRSGLFGRARISRGERTSILVPRSAVLRRGQLQAIYVLDSAQIASLRYVTLGNVMGDKVEVLSGLGGGERMVTNPGDKEFDGKKIEVKP
jgi:RND family efflux transporter MFP subunit